MEPDEVITEQKTPKSGTCTISVAFNLNMGNYENLKVNIGFSEPYSGISDDTRESKYQELKELTNLKIQELIIDQAKTIKDLSSEIHKFFNGKNK